MISFKPIPIVVCFMCGTLFAAQQSTLSIFLQAGYALLLSKGDFNERVLSVEDEEGTKGNLHPPDISILSSPDIAVGVNIKSFSLSLNFNYSSTDESLTGYPDGNLERETRIWRIGTEFTYNIFWPEFFQGGIGLGFTYINAKTKDNLFYGSDTYGYGIFWNCPWFNYKHALLHNR